MSKSITIQTSKSSTLKSAQSKKCNLLKKLAAHTTQPKVALAILAYDPLLQTILTPAEILDTYQSRVRPNQLSNRTKPTLVKLTINLDDPPADDPEDLDDEETDAE